MIINGRKVHVIIPVFHRNFNIEFYVIAAGDNMEAVSAYIKTLDDIEWYWGNYFNEDYAIIKAIADAYKRSKIQPKFPLGPMHPSVL